MSELWFAQTRGTSAKWSCSKERERERTCPDVHTAENERLGLRFHSARTRMSEWEWTFVSPSSCSQR